MNYKFDSLCQQYFDQTQKELSDREFQDIQKVIGMWPLPDSWEMPNKPSKFLKFPTKGLCVVEAPFESIGNFKISISVKMGEIRIGFLFPHEFDSIIDESNYAIQAFIDREFVNNGARSKSTLTNFSKLPGGQVIIDFIFYDQFADLNAMNSVSSKNEAEGLACSMAMTVSHLYCSLVCILLTQRSIMDSGLADDIWRDPSTGVISRLYVVIDPESRLSKESIEEELMDLNGQVKSLYKTNSEVSVLHIEWSFDLIFEMIDAQRHLRNWALNMGVEISPHANESEEIEIQGLSEEDVD